jgi:hypothetical protein
MQLTKEQLMREFYEERAAIREFDGGQSRIDADRDAWEEAVQKFDPPKKSPKQFVFKSTMSR